MSTFTGTEFVIEADGGSVTQLTANAYTPNDYLLKANNLSDIPNRNTARENLGINVSPIAPVSPKINDLWVDLDS